MLTGLLCLEFLVLMSLTPGVTGQVLTLDHFNNSLTRSVCHNPSFVFEGERIVLTAKLNSSQTSTNDWPANILLQQQYPVYVNICQIRLERSGCGGLRPGACGYCDHQSGQVYNLVFNLTALRTDNNYASFRCMWDRATSSARNISQSVGVYILGFPYSTTSLEQGVSYTVQGVTRETVVPSSSYTTLATRISNSFVTDLTWRYRNDVYHTIRNSNYIYFDLIDDVIDISFHDTCSKSWTLSIPVTDKPELVCDLPVTSRNNPTGTKVKITCRFSTPHNPPSSYCRIRSQPYYGDVTIDGDLITCTMDISNLLIEPHLQPEIEFHWYFILDTQFMNGTRQIPRVGRFNVNGSRSITVEPGANITFECKVYGNPSARCVLVGPGTGRMQEYLFTTDLVHYTLTDVQSQDAGRYWCKGVNQVGTTVREGQAYVDVNIRYPTAIRSHVPTNKDRKFNFDPDSAVLITLEVYGYPAPTQFGLQVQQGSTSVNVSTDRYTVKYVSLNTFYGLVSLFMFNNSTQGPQIKHSTQGPQINSSTQGPQINSSTQGSQIYVLSISNGYNSSVEFQFELEGVTEGVGSGPETVEPENHSGSQFPWLYAFIAVIGAFVVFIAVIIIIYLVKKHGTKDRGKSDSVRSSEQNLPANRGNRARENSYKLEAQSSATPHESRQEAKYSESTSDDENTLHYQNVAMVDDGGYEIVIFDNNLPKLTSQEQASPS